MRGILRGSKVQKFGIGQPVPRFEDPRLVRGGGRYVDDMALPGMAFGYVLRSPHAHAKISSIDVTAAKAAPGVLAVLTGAVWRACGWGALPVPGGLKRRDGSPMYRPRYPALVWDRVRWVGDYVAFVVAETWHQAADAAELVVADYEPLAAVVSTAEAPAGGAPRVFDGCPNNICFVHLEGDKALTDAAFTRATHVVRQHFVIDAELALDAEGAFLALRVKTIANVGAYLQTAASAFVGNLGSLAGVYRTPAIHADVTAVFTNTNPVRPYRGNGRPEAAYVIERMIDLAADAIGVDAVELRERNTIPSDALPFRTGLTFTYY